MINATNITFIQFNNDSLYNTGCISENARVAEACTKFHLTVLNTYHARFITATMILFALILFQYYIKYREPNFSQTEFWKQYIDARLMLITICLIAFDILYLFFL